MSRGLRTLRALRRIVAAHPHPAVADAGAERGGSFGRDPFRSLARAESQGAAPGTEWRQEQSAESSPLGARSAPSRARRDVRAHVLAAIAVLSFAVGLWQFGGALYIQAKAEVAQMLLRTAWLRTHDNGTPVKPWPWADTHPVARLTVAAYGVDVLVLEGANGRALAFGPGHVESSALPGERGHSVISAHRDTHFRFLRKLAIGDEIVVEQPTGARFSYRVTALAIRNAQDVALVRDTPAPTLTLVTCYPFNALAPGGPLRYVVTARSTTPRTDVKT
jgi:sortase A